MIQDRRNAVLLAIVTLLAAQVLVQLGWLNGVDNALLGLCFRLRGPQPPSSQVAIVGFDALMVRQGMKDHASTDLGLYAELVDKLRQAGVETIALDLPDLIYMGSRRLSSADGQRLIRSIRKSGNVILPCALEPPDPAGRRLSTGVPASFSLGPGHVEVPWHLREGFLGGPPAPLADVAAGVGHLNLYPDTDGVVRTLPLLLTAQGRLWPALALEAVRAHLGAPLGSARMSGGVVHVGDRSFTANNAAETFINFAGGYKHYPYLSLCEVLDGNIEVVRESLEGKIALVGPTSHGSYWRTPVHPLMPGVEVVANAVGNLLDGTALRPVAWWVSTVIGLLCALLLGIMVPPAGAVRGALLSSGLLVAVVAATVTVFFQGAWLPAGVGLLTVLLAGMALAVRSSAASDRTRAETEARFASRVAAIASIGSVAASATNRRELLDAIVEWVERELQVPAVSILLVDERQRKLVFEVASGEKGAQVKSFTVGMGEGIAGTVAQTGEPLIVNDAASDPRHFHAISDAVDFPVERALCVPIRLREEIVGVIEALNKTSGRFTLQDQALLMVIAQQAALFLEIAQLYSQLEVRVAEATAELQDANRTLASQKAQLETLLYEIESGVIATDGHDRVTTWNKAVERLLRVTATQAQGKPALVAISHPRLSQMLAMPLSPIGGRYSEDIEIQVDGKAIIVRASVTMMAADKGFGKLVLLTDITQLKEIDRMKTDLISFVSHELQNPLSSIRGFAHLLQKKTPGDSPNARLIRVLNQQTIRMQWLVEDFLDMSRIESGTPLAVQPRAIYDVETMIGEAVELHALTTQDHEFFVEIPDDLPPPYGDRRKLEQVLVNLLENAVKYSPDGGQIRVTAERQDAEVVFSVFDQGIGISEDELPNLFQRFRRARRTRKRISGTGIGLFLSRSLIEAQGGRIWAEATGDGSVFRFTVPVSTQQATEGETDAATNSPTDG